MSERDDTSRNAESGSREAYYADARIWAQDRAAAQASGARRAWVLAGVATAIAALEAFALIALAPLKTVAPYTLLVDHTTGSVQALDGAGAAAVHPQGALIQSLLTQYVVARETFDINSISEQYRKVALWSAEKARADYIALMPADNPDSPLHRFAHGTIVSTSIESVSPIAADTAMVRFATERRDQNQGPFHADYWVAVLHYRFSGQPMAIADRLINPLGFQVVQYRRDQEAPPPQAEAAPQAASLPKPGAVPAAAATGNPGSSGSGLQYGAGQAPMNSAPPAPPRNDL